MPHRLRKTKDIFEKQMQESHRAAMLLLDLTARWIIRLCMIQAAEMIKSSVSSGRLTLYESLFSSAIQKKSKNCNTSFSKTVPLFVLSICNNLVYFPCGEYLIVYTQA